MFRFENSQMIAKYLLFSLLCFDPVFSATIKTAQTLGHHENDGIYGEFENEAIDAEYEDILNLDFFRFTTRKRYIWEDWDVTFPTRDPADYNREDSSSAPFVLYIVVILFIAGVVGTLAYYCINKLSDSDSNSSTSADRFTTVHRPPERRRYLSTQVHRPPIGTNQFPDSRRELLGEPVIGNVVNGLDSYGATVSATAPNISFVNSSYAFSARDTRGSENTVAEKPPDYSTVTLSDLVNPNKPSFPLVKIDKETPPPAYGKENPLFK